MQGKGAGTHQSEHSPFLHHISYSDTSSLSSNTPKTSQVSVCETSFPSWFPLFVLMALLQLPGEFTEEKGRAYKVWRIMLRGEPAFCYLSLMTYEIFPAQSPLVVYPPTYSYRQHKSSQLEKKLRNLKRLPHAFPLRILLEGQILIISERRCRRLTKRYKFHLSSNSSSLKKATD